MTKYLGLTLGTILFALGLTMAPACGAPTDCHKGDVCDCSGQGVCVWNCVDEGCSFTVGGQGTANLTCDQGGCSLTADGQGTVNFSCAGGHCTVNASGEGTVVLDCSGGGCSSSCGGSGTCNTTNCTDCTCNETTLTATCG